MTTLARGEAVEAVSPARERERDEGLAWERRGAHEMGPEQDAGRVQGESVRRRSAQQRARGAGGCQANPVLRPEGIERGDLRRFL